jgi:hypothetical protein
VTCFREKGSVLVLVLLVVSVLMLSGVALMARALSATRFTGSEQHKVRALYIAEAGISRARWRLGLESSFTNVPPADNLYTNEAFGGGTYSVVLSERTPTEATIRSTGRLAAVGRTIAVRIRRGSAWWDPAWRFRRRVTIANNAASDLADYQVRVSIPFQAGKMNIDYSDLRFVDAGMAEIPYWIEAADAACAIVWVRVPAIPAGGTTEIAVYYGNASAVTASSIAATMEPGYTSYNIAATWTDRTSTISIASGDNVGAWVDLAFTFLFYQAAQTRVYACSNGYLSFGGTYNNDRRNSSNKLRQRSMIAALWDDLRTDTVYSICDQPGIYVDSYADHVLIDWEAYRRGSFGLRGAALFQVTLFRNGDVLLSRGAAVNDGLIDETVCVSRGSGGLYADITGESQPDRSWLLAMRKYVEPEPTAEIHEEETASPTSVIYWKEE